MYVCDTPWPVHDDGFTTLSLPSHTSGWSGGVGRAQHGSLGLISEPSQSGSPSCHSTHFGAPLGVGVERIFDTAQKSVDVGLQDVGIGLEQLQNQPVPREAVLDDGDDRIVFVRRGDAYVRRVVTTGARTDGLLEILSGLEEGEEVVTSGAYQLKSKLYRQIVEAAGHGH